MNEKTEFTPSDLLILVDAHRVAAGSVLLLLLGIGLYGYLPLIHDEWARLEYWQRAAIWIADVTSVSLVIRRMFLVPGDQSVAQFQSNIELNKAKSQMRWISLSLMFSLLADIGITMYGIYVEKVASERSIRTAATVISVKEIPWNAVAHYKLTVRFNDAMGRTHEGLIVFTRMKEGFPLWIDGVTAQAVANGALPVPIRIRYDPQRPARVWAAEEPWNRGQALVYAFALIHFFQLIAIGSATAVVLFNRELRPSPAAIRFMPILALTVEACAVALWGTLFRIRGF